MRDGEGARHREEREARSDSDAAGADREAAGSDRDAAGSDGEGIARGCPPCRGGGKVISNLGGDRHEVPCPWCGGTGIFQQGRDAQQEDPADRLN